MLNGLVSTRMVGQPCVYFQDFVIDDYYRAAIRNERFDLPAAINLGLPLSLGVHVGSEGVLREVFVANGVELWTDNNTKFSEDEYSSHIEWYQSNRLRSKEERSVFAGKERMG